MHAQSMASYTYDKRFPELLEYVTNAANLLIQMTSFKGLNLTGVMETYPELRVANLSEVGGYVPAATPKAGPESDGPV